MHSGLPHLLTEQCGIPSPSSCGCDDASEKVERPQCDRQQTTAAVRGETSLKGKPPVDGWDEG